MALEIGNKVRTYVAAAGLGLSAMTIGATAGFAEQVNNVITQTTFSSPQEANQYAQGKGLVLAIASNGATVIVSQELADLMVRQGFTRWNDGTIRGYESENFFEFLESLLNGTYTGYNFVHGSPYLSEHATSITIKGAQGGNDNSGDQDPTNPGDVWWWDPETF